MKIAVGAKGFRLTSERRELVQVQVRDAFLRFQDCVRQLRVNLEDENGPKKGVDRLVQLVIDIEHLPLVVVKERGSSWESTLCRAIDRAVQSVRRNLTRRRSHAGAVGMAGVGEMPLSLR